MDVTSTSRATTADASETIDAAFTLDRDRAIRLSRDKASDAHIRHGNYLARALARQPGDLIRHVQRIHLHIENADGRRLYGALVDLFIALGSRGAALRRRMLEASRAVLDAGQFARLEGALADGLQANHRLGDIPGSVLGRPVRGSLELVVRAVRAAPVRSALEEARALLDDGYVDEARQLLESALDETPYDAALADELLPIYRAQRDRRGYETTRQMLDSFNALPASWQRFNDSTEDVFS